MAAAVWHTVNLGTHERAPEEAGAQGLPFTKGPLVFETTGAMGEDTQKWWKSIVEMEADQRIPGACVYTHIWSCDHALYPYRVIRLADQRIPGAPQSRREQGLEHTWPANKLALYWLQTFSMSHARMQAESIAQWIGTCQRA